MKEDKYTQASNNLAKAADIAIDSFKKYPPKNWNEETLNHVLNCYSEWKENSLNPEKKFRKLTSLKHIIEHIFTVFQESNGDYVEEFWKEIKAQNLPYKRENKLAKIIKRKKINNIHEFDFVIDVIVPYQQEGLINTEEVVLLNKWLGEFENLKKK